MTRLGKELRRLRTQLATFTGWDRYRTMDGPLGPGKGVALGVQRSIQNKTGILFGAQLQELYREQTLSLDDLIGVFRVGKQADDLLSVSFDHPRTGLEIWQSRAPYDSESERAWHERYVALRGAKRRRDPRVQPTLLQHHRWFPLASMVDGSALYYDADPTSAGDVGQLIFYRHGPSEIFYVAKDLASFFAQTCDLLAQPRVARELHRRGPDFVLKTRSKKSTLKEEAKLIASRVPDAAQLAELSPASFARSTAPRTLREELEELRLLTAFANRGSTYTIGSSSLLVPEAPILGAPARTAELAELEAALGWKLPPSFREFLVAANGIERFDRTLALLSTDRLAGPRHARLTREFLNRHRGAVITGHVIGYSEYHSSLICLLPKVARNGERAVEYRFGPSVTSTDFEGARVWRYASMREFLTSWTKRLRRKARVS